MHSKVSYVIYHVLLFRGGLTQIDKIFVSRCFRLKIICLTREQTKISSTVSTGGWNTTDQTEFSILQDDTIRKWSSEVAKEIAEQKPEFAVVHVQGLLSAQDPDYMGRVILSG